MANIEKSKPEFVTRNGIIADADYVQWLSDVKKRFRESQARTIVKVNSEMLEFYWSIGRDLVTLRAESRWGAGVVKQFALDMRETFPDATGFSYTNVKYMKRWYTFYNELVVKGQQAADLIREGKGHQAGDLIEEEEKSQQVVGQIEKGQQAADLLEIPDILVVYLGITMLRLLNIATLLMRRSSISIWWPTKAGAAVNWRIRLPLNFTKHKVLHFPISTTRCLPNKSN